MSDKPTAAKASNSKKRGLKRGLSLYTKIILTLLLLLALATAAFVYNAWRQLTLSNATNDINVQPLAASVEMLTPTGAQNSNGVFIPPAQPASVAAAETTSAMAASDTATARTGTNALPKPATGQAETPVLPIPSSTATAPEAATPQPDTDVPVTPIQKQKTPKADPGLDNLF
ncbi:hypothetical protein PT286_08570 [Neisseriaceae bacterium ESL0693]|nr:hypothetical protein [Neisseriaceae bacterium ESL0693]